MNESNYLSSDQLEEIKELAKKKLLNIRFHPKYPDIAILKYSKRAFWTGAWDEHKILMKTRGMIIDIKTGRILLMPFDKVFNYGEKREQDNMFAKDEVVFAVEKINGFLALATYDEELDDYFICSSGTFDSDFCLMVEQYLNNEHTKEMLRDRPDLGFMFEICHPNDPHIVEQEHGAYLIGARGKSLNSNMIAESILDEFYHEYLVGDRNIHRPSWYTTFFGNHVENRGNWEGVEGWMIVSRDYQRILKIKGSYYLIMKFLSRSNKTNAIWEDPKNFLKTVDEDFHELVGKLPEKISLEDWKGIDDQERLVILKGIYDELMARHAISSSLLFARLNNS